MASRRIQAGLTTRAISAVGTAEPVAPTLPFCLSHALTRYLSPLAIKCELTLRRSVSVQQARAHYIWIENRAKQDLLHLLLPILEGGLSDCQAGNTVNLSDPFTCRVWTEVIT